MLPSREGLDRVFHEADGEAMGASVAAWRIWAVREEVMGLKSDNDWISSLWSVHVTEFLAYFASAARLSTASWRLTSFTSRAFGRMGQAS